MEAYSVATMRNIPDAHPLFRLLVPHFRYTIGINENARKVLINKGGIIDQAFSIGGKGKELRFQRACKVFDVRGADVKANVKKRGVEDPHLLPNYYYRDDGILIWDTIESYVRDIISIYYKSDNDVKKYRNGPMILIFLHSQDTMVHLLVIDFLIRWSHVMTLFTTVP